MSQRFWIVQSNCKSVLDEYLVLVGCAKGKGPPGSRTRCTAAGEHRTGEDGSEARPCVKDRGFKLVSGRKSGRLCRLPS